MASATPATVPKLPFLTPTHPLNQAKVPLPTAVQEKRGQMPPHLCCPAMLFCCLSHVILMSHKSHKHAKAC